VGGIHLDVSHADFFFLGKDKIFLHGLSSYCDNRERQGHLLNRCI
jgi:hypothetical protein